ncbi:MAG: pentapeptide repeat-containing protein [Chromatiales bacterium]
MSEQPHGHRLWYTRRDGQVRGPFPEPVIHSHILLGRLHEDDELSRDREDWRRLSQLPDLIPEVMRRVVTEEDRARLAQARLHADERLRDRRDGDASWDGANRRRDDRRRPESELMISHRQAWNRIRVPLGRGPRAALLPTLVIVLAASLAIGLFRWYTPATQSAASADCGARAAPGVNWSYCHLEGLSARGADLRGANLANANLSGADLQRSKIREGDLSYANLGAANLRGADLADSRLVGAVLSRANLDQSDLRAADLSYANLRGARLGSADLSKAVLAQAIWIDGSLCAPDSIGTCR